MLVGRFAFSFFEFWSTMWKDDVRKLTKSKEPGETKWVEFGISIVPQIQLAVSLINLEKQDHLRQIHHLHPRGDQP